MGAEADGVRSYVPADQAKVEELFTAAWSTARFPLDLDGAHSDLRRIPEVYLAGGGGFWLAERSGEIVGAVAIRRFSHDIAELKRFVVLEAQRGSGIGRSLLDHALSHAAAGGFETVRLDTLRNPGPALHLFEKLGFVEIARYNESRAADLFMEKRLAQDPKGR